MRLAIEVNDLGKLYRLGEVGTGTLSHDLKRWMAKVRGQEDPYEKVGSVNDRTKTADKDEYVWALRNISFSISQGDVVGIIGRNGAGKSTLLKVLSRITAPSKGEVKIRGRIGSLLE
jgi:lipopolysaccharide transport system ATP-binding protein